MVIKAINLVLKITYTRIIYVITHPNLAVIANRNQNINMIIIFYYL